MALRISASGQALSSTANLPGANGFTICGWFNMTTDRNAATGIFGVSGTTGIFIQTDVTGTQCQVQPTGGGGSGSSANYLNFTVGTWHSLALAVGVNGIGSMYHGTAATNTLTVGSVNVSSLSGASAWRLGQFDSTSANFFNGRMAAVKCWTNKLTAAEVALERMSYMPSRTADLAKFSPFINAENTDYSGNGGTWTGSGYATEAGPPILWSALSQLDIPVYEVVPITARRYAQQQAVRRSYSY